MTFALASSSSATMAAAAAKGALGRRASLASMNGSRTAASLLTAERSAALRVQSAAYSQLSRRSSAALDQGSMLRAPTAASQQRFQPVPLGATAAASWRSVLPTVQAATAAPSAPLQHSRRLHTGSQRGPAAVVVGSFRAGRRPVFSARHAVLQYSAARRHQHTETSTSHSGGESSPPPGMPGSSSSSSSSQQRQPQQTGRTPQSSTSATARSSASASSSPSTQPEQPKQKQSTSSSSQAVSSSSSSSSKKSSSGDKALEKSSDKPKGPLLKRIWSTVKHEAQHYWHGTKLLGKEISISSRLVRRTMMGYSLTRRERRQLKRTLADLLRLIPFVPFVIVPFAELLLPVAIKIFPNMLPSTFESKFALEEKRRGLIKVRLEMAKFLQETIKEGGLQATEQLQSTDEFKEFFRKVRSTGESPSAEDVLRVARLFEDDLTLDNLSRPQLVSVCRYMNINAFGTDNYLRYQIRNRLGKIKRDDMVITHEGVDSLSGHELQQACQARGISCAGLSEDRLREEMAQWIDLHLHKRISGTLLILSKAFNFVAATDSGSGGKGPSSEQPQLKSLELTLSSLPDNLLNEAELNVNKDGATNKQRLEVLQEQEDLIEDEAEQEQEEREAREAEKERKSAEKARLAKEEEEAKALLPEGELKAGAQADASGSSSGPKAEEEDADARMTNEQLSELGEALSLLSAKSSVMREREELKKLMEEVSGTDASEMQKQLDAAAALEESEHAKKDAAASPDAQESEAAQEEAAEKKRQAKKLSQQSSATRSLAKRVSKMLQKIDQQIEAYDQDVGSRLHIIEASPSGKISVDDLEQALRLIKHRPDEQVLEKLVDKLDVDHDGLIPLSDVLELAKAESGLGIMRDDEVQDIREQGKAIKSDRDRPIRKSDIVDE